MKKHICQKIIHDGETDLCQRKSIRKKWLSKFREKQSRYEVVKLKPGSMSKYAGDKMILRTVQIAEPQKAPEDQKEKQNIQKTGTGIQAG